MIASLCLACLVGLLVTGALIDIEYRRLPNWLTSAVAILYALFVIVSPTPVHWMSASIVALLVFAVAFSCFAFQLMGGGDVKLLAALALWAGVDHIALFLTMTGLAGGALAIVMIMLRRWASSPMVLLLSPLFGLVSKRLTGSPVLAGSSSSTDMTEADLSGSLPYGVAIAAGGFTVIYALLQL